MRSPVVKCLIIIYLLNVFVTGELIIFRLTGILIQELNLTTATQAYPMYYRFIEGAKNHGRPLSVHGVNTISR